MPTLDQKELDELEKLAEAAAWSGRWQCEYLPLWGSVYRIVNVVGFEVAAVRSGQDKNAHYIAAASPAVVLELIKELRESKRKVDMLHAFIERKHAGSPPK